jgi:hypothetical protein
LDGKDFTINNLKISTSQVYVGLIGYNEGTIKNLKLDNVEINVTGGLSSNIYGGAFIGYNNSSSEIENLHTLSGDIYIKKRGDNLGYLGGIVGYQNNSITFISVSNSLTVNGDTTNATGGLVGFNKNQLIIQNNKNLGNINGLNTTKKVGGFIGESYQLTLTGSINSGSVSGTESVGGFVGKGMANITIENSINEALISGTAWNIGGFLGEMQYGTLVVNDSHNKGNILATQSLGGIIGTGGKIILNNTFNLGNISGTGTVYSTAGGLIGYGSQAILYKSYNRGDVFGYGWFVGGLIARSIGSVTEITSSYNFGNISGKSYTGGIIGREVTGLRIINSYNTGEVMAISKVGGIVGSTGYATFFEGVINIGDVNAQNDVGGLIGEAEYSLVALHSVNFGLVLASNTTLNIGGITGKLPSNNDIEQTYYSGSITSNGVEVDGVAFGTKVTDLSTFNLEFFTTTLGWDTEVWDFTGLNIANGVYPTLKNMPEIPVEE